MPAALLASELAVAPISFILSTFEVATPLRRYIHRPTGEGRGAPWFSRNARSFLTGPTRDQEVDLSMGHSAQSSRSSPSLFQARAPGIPRRLCAYTLRCAPCSNVFLPLFIF